MTTPAYPFGLSTILRAGKSRSQPASFRIAEPRRGYGYAQAIGTDTPVFWDVQFRFNPADAVRFRLWFVTVTARGLSQFTMPIRTEFGTVTHTCQFLDGNLLDTTEEGESFTYTAQIMARAEVIPAAYTDAADMIIGLPRWDVWAEFLDRAIAAMPEA